MIFLNRMQKSIVWVEAEAKFENRFPTHSLYQKFVYLLIICIVTLVNLQSLGLNESW